MSKQAHFSLDGSFYSYPVDGPPDEKGVPAKFELPKGAKPVSQEDFDKAMSKKSKKKK